MHINPWPINHNPNPKTTTPNLGPNRFWCPHKQERMTPGFPHQNWYHRPPSDAFEVRQQGAVCQLLWRWQNWQTDKSVCRSLVVFACPSWLSLPSAASRVRPRRPSPRRPQWRSPRTRRGAPMARPTRRKEHPRAGGTTWPPPECCFCNFKANKI